MPTLCPVCGSAIERPEDRAQDGHLAVGEVEHLDERGQVTAVVSVGRDVTERKAAEVAFTKALAKQVAKQGIRVNALSAGPIKTLASSGISGFGSILDHHRTKSPLRKLVELDEVADGALFLLSDLGRGVTGQTLYVDGGYNIMAI